MHAEVAVEVRGQEKHGSVLGYGILLGFPFKIHSHVSSASRLLVAMGLQVL